MKKFLLLAISFFLVGYIAQAQSVALRDSLSKKLQTLPNDTNRVIALNELGFEMRHTKPDMTYLLGQQAYELARTLNYPVGEARSCGTMAAAYKFLGDFAKSLKMYNQAKELYVKIGDEDRVAVILNNTADLYMLQGEWQKSLETMKECYSIYTSLSNPNLKAGSKSVYLTNLAESYYNLNQLDSAIICLNQALPLAKAKGESILTTTYYLLGDVALAQNNMMTADSFYRRSIRVAIQENRYSDMYEAYYRMSKRFQKTSQRDSTLHYAKLALTYAQKGNNAKGILKSSDNLSALYQGNDDTEALRYYKIAVAAKDSLYSQDKVRRLLSITFEEKEQAQKIEAAKVEYQNRIKFSVLMGILAVFAGITLLLYKNNRQKQKANNLLQEQRDEIERTLTQLTSAQVLLAAKNAENELLLKEIHHRVKNNLEIVSSLLQLQTAQFDDPAIHSAMLTSQNRVHSMGIIHQKLYQGKHLGVVEMRDYFINLSESILDSFNAEGRVKIECNMPQLVLDVDTAISIGLITNELITNSLKYAFTEKQHGAIKISLTEQQIVGNTEGVFLLKISDDGIGKPVENKPKGTGFGSQLITLLTKQLDGQLNYEINHGTIVSLAFKKPKGRGLVL
jgi:two-component system, NtrC family, sensor kinase